MYKDKKFLQILVQPTVDVVARGLNCSASTRAVVKVDNKQQVINADSVSKPV